MRARVSDGKIRAQAITRHHIEIAIPTPDPFMLLSRHAAVALAVFFDFCSAPLPAFTATQADEGRFAGRALASVDHRAESRANPARFAVGRSYYGSGTDKHRAAFRDSVTLKTKTVDGSPFVSAPPEIAKARAKDWGFDFKKLPINGRVWYPQGDGPFPLVLIVHGNHDMLDFSDPGYGYLGELLASRGFILVSVDENFINGNLRGESDGRGWLLLKHIERWRAWNDSSGSPFYHKVDMNNIGLMGHSRGGEAVAIAAAFNRLSHYPDDANVKFNFNFDIKSIFAIAPVDGQYQPAGKLTPIENVNYMVIPRLARRRRVRRSSGCGQYQRIKFTDGKPWFKSAWYVYRANHGQWNTVWGNKDNGPRSGRWLALDAAHLARGAAPVQQGVHRRLSRGDAQGEEGVPADVPRSSRRSASGCRRRCTSRASRKRASARSPGSTRTSTSRPARCRA